MHAHVRDVATLWLLLLPQVLLMLVVEELDERHPAVAVVHVVAEARRVNDRQVHLEPLLFQLRLDDVDVDCLAELLRVPVRLIPRLCELCAEEGIDHWRKCLRARSTRTCRLSRSTLTHDHQREVCTLLRDDLVPLRVSVLVARLAPQRTWFGRFEMPAPRQWPRRARRTHLSAPLSSWSSSHTHP